MNIPLSFPVTRSFPGSGPVEIPRVNVAAGQSNAVIYSIPVPQKGALLEVLLFAEDTVNNEVATYRLNCVARNQPSRAVKATGTLTSSGNFTDGQTVTIGSKVYTFQTTLTNADGNVAIGADRTASHANLIAAINLGSGSGTAYAADMTIHPTVEGVSSNATTSVVRAKTAGTAGNSIATTETQTNASWGASTLASGADAAVIVGSVASLVTAEDDASWAATVTVNGTAGTFEVKVTSDASNITAFSGAYSLVKLD